MTVLDSDVNLPNEYPISLKRLPTEEDINFCLQIKGVTSAKASDYKILYTTDGSIDPATVHYEFQRGRPR